MDINPIDIKIKEFALYLKDFGLLNETNINDFLKKFKSVSENSISSSGRFETDINVGLIYLKENLSKTMLEFYNLMTEERKKIIYLNIYSKFIQKREIDLQNKGAKLYNVYTSLFIKKYFSNWKKGTPYNDKHIKKIEYIYKKPNIFQDFKKDNFCFDILPNIDFSSNNNVVINSNNNKILFNTNTSTKFNSSNINNSSLNKLNSNRNSNSNNNINSFLLTSKSRISELNSPISSIKNNDKIPKYFKPQVDKENILDRLFYPNKIKKEEKDQKYNLYNITNINRSCNEIKNSSGSKKRIYNIKQNNNNNNNSNINNRNLGRKTVNHNYKEIEELNEDNFKIQKQKMRNTYSSYSARPRSSFHSNENNRPSVYQRLYDQNKEKIKRQEERIKENLNEIKERANHPIQKKNSYNNFRNLKKNQNVKNKTTTNKERNLYGDKFKITYDGESQNYFDKQYVSKNFDEVLFEKSNKSQKVFRSNEEKRKEGQNFIENQRKCIEMFNEMIEKEEKRSGKNINENEKENMFKDLLNKLYKENKNDIDNGKINKNNINEDEKVNENNNTYNNTCQSVEIKLK